MGLRDLDCTGLENEPNSASRIFFDVETNLIHFFSGGTWLLITFFLLQGFSAVYKKASPMNGDSFFADIDQSLYFHDFLNVNFLKFM